MHYGLSPSEARQLQETLATRRCAPAPVVGIIGPRTRAATACARTHLNVWGENTNDLLRSPQLDFTALSR